MTLPSWLHDEVSAVARRLLGCELLVKTEQNETVRLKIVETEAYHQSDAASHSFKGKTPRTEVMFGAAGHLYVYFTYGMHYCMNIVTGKEGEGSAVLIRAAEPLEGKAYLQKNRPGVNDINLVNGPAKLCQALHITNSWNGHNLSELPLQFIEKPPITNSEIVQTTRIGISKAKDKPWRFYIKGNRFVSKP